MFKNTVPLSTDAHRHLKLQASQPYQFAAGLMLCPVVSGEICQVARDYVIVFPAESGGIPQALLGAEQGVNAYVADTGHWRCRYVPAHVRRYPFMAAERPAGTESPRQSFTVMIDLSAPQLNDAQGESLFTPDGKPSSMLDKVQKALISLQQDFRTTADMVASLEQLGLLVSRSIRVTLGDGREHALEGFRVIDTGKLAALAPEALADLNKNGALLLAYSHIISMANLKDGVIARQAGGLGPISGPGPDDPGESFGLNP